MRCREIVKVVGYYFYGFVGMAVSHFDSQAGRLACQIRSVFDVFNISFTNEGAVTAAHLQGAVIF